MDSSSNASASRAIGVLLVLISALVFSSAGLFVKGVSADAWTIMFWRGLFAAIFTGCYVCWRNRLRLEFRYMGKPGSRRPRLALSRRSRLFRHSS